MSALRRNLVVGLLISAALAAVVLMAQALPEPLGIDWRLTYRPAAQAVLRGQNPYTSSVAPQAPFFAAPWGLLPLMPLVLLPARIGRVFVMLGGLLAFAYTAIRLGAKPLSLALFLLSPPVMHCILNANIEWLPLLGFVLPPPVGMLFIAVKPQTGFAVGVFWLVEAWRKDGWRGVVRLSAPVSLAFLASFVLYGLWPLRLLQAPAAGVEVNSSLWPISIPIGLALLVTAIQKRQIAFAMPASPCLSPYVLFHAWSSAVIALVGQPLQLAAVVIGLWIAVGLRAIG